MKKIVLFILLLTIPFIVNATKFEDFSLTWKYQTREMHSGMYINNDTFNLYGDGSLVSVDKITGATKSLNNVDRAHWKGDTNIITMTESRWDEDAALTIFDQYMNKVSETKLNAGMKYVGKYDDNYYLAIGSKTEGDYAYIKLFFIDKNGIIAKEDSLKVNYEFDAIENKYYSEEILFKDFNGNMYRIQNYKLVPYNKNSDGSYMYLENTKLHKMSSTGEEIGSLDIPDGRGTRIYKKGNQYYIVTGRYTSTDENTHYVQLDLYLVDQNLNVLYTKSLEAPPERARYVLLNPEGFPSDVYDIVPRYNQKTVLYLETSTASGERKTYAYEVSNQLGLTTYSYFSNSGYEKWFNSSSLNGSKYFFFTGDSYLGWNWDDMTKEEANAIASHFPEDDYEKYYYAKKNGNDYVFFADSYKCEGTGCTYPYDGPSEHHRKTEFLYVDSNYNIVYRKDLIPWDSEYNEEDVFIGQWGTPKDTRHYVRCIEKTCMIAVTSSIKNLIYLIDEQGNIIKDFSEDLKDYGNLGASDMYVTDKGFYIAIGGTKYIEDNSSNWTEEGPNSLILYYSQHFNIKKKVNGEGTISSVDTAAYAEEVTFEFKPAFGYTLDNVKVTDKNGNVLTFTNNVLTMPEKDVIIEATFKKLTIETIVKNPETRDTLIIVALLLLIISGTYTFSAVKRLKRG